LRRDFNSVPPFPQDVAKNLSTALDHCMKDFANLQAIIQRLTDGGSSMDNDLVKSRDSLEAHKGTLNITLMLANR
jgi:hypothetical protein